MRKTLFVTAASAALLSACGGGGGGDAAPTATNAATVALSGTAAKGLMANADVDVFAVKANGEVDSVSLAHAITGPTGNYSLSFAGTKDQPYVVRVSANAITTHLDEISNSAQPLPAGFVMRSLVVPSASGAVTTSASITPFSEMAVAAAAKASGGVTAANTAQAVSSLGQLLGFDPIKVTARKLDDASGSDEQKLAVMLTAVSQLANSGSLGCSSGSGGDKVKCVVEKMRDSSGKDSIKLGSGSGDDDVSGKLAAALNTVLADDNVRGKVDDGAALFVDVVAKLGCGTADDRPSCAAAPLATVNAIAAAKQLFGQIKTDWSAMFSAGGASSIASGAVNQEAFKIQTALTGVQVPAEMLVKDLGALLMGIDLYNDYKAGRSSSPSRGRGDGSQVSGDGSVPDSATSPVGCTLYQDATTTTTATAPANANFIGCSARFYISRSFVGASTDTVEWRHGFTVTPNVNGSFGYQTRARRRVTSCTGGNCSVTTNEALQTDAAGTALAAFAGSLTPTLSGSFGSITAFTLVGDLPAAFQSGSNKLQGHHHTASLSGTRSVAASSAVTATLAGTLMAKDSADATVSTLSIKPGSTVGETPLSFDANGNGVRPGSASAVSTGGSTPSLVSLDVVFGTASAEFEGVVAITGTTWDKSGTASIPTQLTLSGALRNIGAAGSTEFFKGQANAQVTGYAAFDATLPRGTANSFSVGLTLVGTITASGRPTLEFTFGSSESDADSAAGIGPRQATLQYRTLVAGVPRTVVSVSALRNASGGNDFKLTEASAGLEMRWTGRPDSVGLFTGEATRIGTLDAGSGLLTFSDGSFMSLDIGL